jgi:hypothetical protein
LKICWIERFAADGGRLYRRQPNSGLLKSPGRHEHRQGTPLWPPFEHAHVSLPANAVRAPGYWSPATRTGMVPSGRMKLWSKLCVAELTLGYTGDSRAALNTSTSKSKPSRCAGRSQQHRSVSRHNHHALPAVSITRRSEIGCSCAIIARAVCRAFSRWPRIGD